MANIDFATPGGPSRIVDRIFDVAPPLLVAHRHGVAQQCVNDRCGMREGPQHVSPDGLNIWASDKRHWFAEHISNQPFRLSAAVIIGLGHRTEYDEIRAHRGCLLLLRLRLLDHCLTPRHAGPAQADVVLRGLAIGQQTRQAQPEQVGHAFCADALR